MGQVIRRKKYFVEKDLQLRFFGFVVVLSFASAIITGIAIFFTTFSLLGGKLADVYPQGRVVTIFNSVYWVFFASMLIILPFIFGVSIMFSHRIAGPLPKIYQALESVANGNFDIKLTLRRKDELKPLGDMINHMAQKLREREAGKK